MSSTTLRVLGALTMLLTCMPFGLHAHDSPVKRELIVQFAPDKVMLMLDYELPAGERVDRLMVRYDLDHDGLIGPLETQRFASALLPSALNGLSFEVIGERPGAQEPEVKIRRTDEGKLAMVVLMTYILPKLEGDTSRSLRVSLDDDPHAIGTPMLAQTTDELAIVALDDKQLAVPQLKLTRVISSKTPCTITVKPQP